MANAEKLRDELTGALIGLARATEGDTSPDGNTYRTIVEGLVMSAPGSPFEEGAISAQTELTRLEKARLVPSCSTCKAPCGRNNDYDMSLLYGAEPDVRSMKSLILLGIRALAATPLSGCDERLGAFLCEALFRIGYEESVGALLPTALKIGELGLK